MAIVYSIHPRRRSSGIDLMIEQIADGPKRIVAFDGGGIRGIFSLQIAKRVEQLFREEYGKPDLVLSDVIDFFAGTSTGAIIATFLAWGYPVDEVERLYINHGKEMFARAWFWNRWFKATYRAEMIANFFKQQFVEDNGTLALLDSKKLKTLLLVVMRNATTGSPWPISSNPNAKYNVASLPDCNLKIALWQLLRASTAAPTFFSSGTDHARRPEIPIRRRRNHSVQQPVSAGGAHGDAALLPPRLAHWTPENPRHLHWYRWAAEPFQENAGCQDQ